MPGAKPRKHNGDGQCHRLATACILGVHWKDAPDLTQTTTGWQFWEKWRRDIKALGWRSEQFTPNGKNEPDNYWLAVVSNGTNNGYNNHSVVMKGHDLYYDPNGERKHRPHNFVTGYKLIPHGNN